MKRIAANRFSHLRFEDFRELALDNSLSKYEKIGFPDTYRAGKEEAIFEDIITKLKFRFTPAEEQVWLDIGPGCSDLPLMIQKLCAENNCRLLLSDAQEMLDMLPDAGHILKFSGAFPLDTPGLVNRYKASVDYINAYSVLPVVFSYSCIYRFIDSAVSMLKPGGRMLIGDIGNISMRKRFFSSKNGIAFHKKFMNTNEELEIQHLKLEENCIDDGIVLGILQRYRGYGYQAYVLPQADGLPMSNRREDILIHKF